MIIFKTSYAGEISINWDQVSSLTTEKPVELVLVDQTVLVSTITSSESGILTLTSYTDFIPVDVNIHNVLYIDVSPHITGKGLKFIGQVNARINVSKGNTENDTDTADKANLHLKVDHFLDQKQYVYTNSSFTRDKFKNRKLKSTVGVGYGYQFWKSGTDILALEDGINYVIEDFYAAEHNSFAAGR